MRLYDHLPARQNAKPDVPGFFPPATIKHSASARRRRLMARIGWLGYGFAALLPLPFMGLLLTGVLFDPAWTTGRALAQIQSESGTKLDARCVEALLKVYRKAPIGVQVRTIIE